MRPVSIERVGGVAITANGANKNIRSVSKRIKEIIKPKDESSAQELK
jgi:hypothetical protein